MHISDVVFLNIQRELSRYATVDKFPRHDDDNDAGTGVHMLFHDNRHVVRFVGVTHDDIHWSVDIDFQDFSRRYYEIMVRDLGREIDKHREARMESAPVIIRPTPEYMH